MFIDEPLERPPPCRYAIERSTQYVARSPATAVPRPGFLFIPVSCLDALDQTSQLVPGPATMFF